VRENIRAQKYIMSSILEYKQQKLSLLYVFHADSESCFSFTVEEKSETDTTIKLIRYFLQPAPLAVLSTTFEMYSYVFLKDPE